MTLDNDRGITTQTPALWRNLLAMVYDTFLVAPLFMANAFIWVTVFGPTENATEATVPAWLMQSTCFVIAVVFFSLFWRKSGQTLGMQAWRIKLTRLDGGTPQLSQCIVRCSVAVISIAAFGLGYWWALIDAEGRRWHDRWSGTRLILVPK